MRRSELSSTDPLEFEELVSQAEVGHLGLVDKMGYPRIIPLNFCAIGETIYFHGALEGEKYELMKAAPIATFSVDIPYSFIPSHFTTKRYACPASHYFKSLHIRGKALPVDDLEEKAEALQGLMEKYQKEGRYQKITSTDKIYLRPLEGVGVYKVEPVEITLKIKFGQNEPRGIIEKVIKGLQKRGSPTDLKTIKMIKFYYPESLD